MREAAEAAQLYLPGGDMHFNSAGTRIAAQITATRVQRLLAADLSAEALVGTPAAASGMTPVPAP